MIHRIVPNKRCLCNIVEFKKLIAFSRNIISCNEQPKQARIMAVSHDSCKRLELGCKNPVADIVRNVLRGTPANIPTVIYAPKCDGLLSTHTFVLPQATGHALSAHRKRPRRLHSWPWPRASLESAELHFPGAYLQGPLRTPEIACQTSIRRQGASAMALAKGNVSSVAAEKPPDWASYTSYAVVSFTFLCPWRLGLFTVAQKKLVALLLAITRSHIRYPLWSVGANIEAVPA